MERKKKKIVLLSVYWSKEVSMMVKGSELPESSFWIQECINLGNYIQSYSLKPLKGYKFSN